MERENEAAVETEQIQVNGEDVEVVQNSDETITINVRPGMTEDEKKALKDTIESTESSKLIAAWHKKNHDANRYLEELKAEREKLEKTEPEQQKQKESSTLEPIWKTLGLKDESLLNEYIDEHPREYAKAVEKQAELRTKALVEEQLNEHKRQTSEQVKQAMFEQTIKANGDDPLTVKAFANLYQMPFSEAAYSLYKQVHSDKSNPITRAQIEAQKQQITILEQPRQRMRDNLTKEEFTKLSSEEQDEYYNYLKETALAKLGG